MVLACAAVVVDTLLSVGDGHSDASGAGDSTYPVVVVVEVDSTFLDQEVAGRTFLAVVVVGERRSLEDVGEE